MSEEQEQLCMWFEQGRLGQGLPPEWFAAVLASADANADFDGALRAAGAQSIESFGNTETFELYRAPNKAGFFVDYTGVYETEGWIFIRNRADYLTFRATYLAPLAILSMQSDRFEAWDRERKEKAGIR